MTDVPKEAPIYNVQSARVKVPYGNGGGATWLRIEFAIDLHDHFVIVGWRSEQRAIQVWADDTPLRVDSAVHPREDVAKALDLTSGNGLGFTFVGKKPIGATVAISWSDSDAPRIQLNLSAPLGEGSEPALPPNQRLAASALLPPFGDSWRLLVAGTEGQHASHDEADGNLEYAACGGAIAIVSGWCLGSNPDVLFWLETTDGRIHQLDDAVRRPRQDVTDTLGMRFPESEPEAGFCVNVAAAVGDIVRLRALVGMDIFDLSEIAVRPLPRDARRAAEQVFGQSASSINDFLEFAVRIASPILSGVLERRAASWLDLQERVSVHGEPQGQPDVSVVVPLYGRIDFVEHQVVEFSRDDWFLKHAELIYVIDDPAILNAFTTMAPNLYALYRVPFRVIWGKVNRGFSGANNLGAKYARGRQLLFLNSDAIPQAAGWLRILSNVLDADPGRGAVAPRLVFADGSIQHARMTFRRREDLGVWVNHHPYMGLDPALDPAGTEDIEVAAVTGACLLVSRQDFDSVEGWDTGYLVGDFEDSDFCLKLRTAGKKIVYTPAVQLTHLERQSFSTIGGSSFRMKVVVYNAARHQARWEDVLNEASNV